MTNTEAVPPRPPPTSKPTSGERGWDELPPMRTRYRSGWHSTKLHLALIAMAVLTVVFVFVVARTSNGAGFGEFCIALVSLVASTQGSRVAESFAQRPATAPSKEG